jgi:hypothetical protein
MTTAGPQQVREDQNEHLARLPTGAERVLLLNPAVYDTRLPWAQWLQPTLLLRLGTHFRAHGTDAKLLDALYHRPTERIRRKRVAILDLDGQQVFKWRHGITKAAIERYLRDLSRSGWYPDEVYVECFTTFWWEGAAEAIALVKKRFPQSRVILLGAYPALAPEHARGNTAADEIGTAPLTGLSYLPGDLSLYEHPPTFGYVTLGEGGKSADDVVDEVVQAFEKKVWSFAFPEHSVVRRFPDLYTSILEKLAAKGLKANFYALGNIAPSDLAANPDLAALMKQAGYVQICFSDDRDGEGQEWLVEDYRTAAGLCHQAGFKPRTEAIVGSVCIGRRGEDLAERAELLTLVSHYAGSVILWPYQPAPAEFPDDYPLEAQNGKLFPYRHQNGLTYRAYTDLLGLSALLNSKYRSCTFDFLGDGLIPRLFRESLEREAWHPAPEVKGTLQLPVILRS